MRIRAYIVSLVILDQGRGLMRKLFLAGVAIAALAAGTSAMAADLETPLYKGPVVLAPNWTGFYIGGNGGAGWGTSELFEPLTVGTDPFSGKDVSNANPNGFLGGVQAGFNYQVGWAVLGIEGSFDWSGIKGDGPAVAFDETFSAKTDWLATATGRVGGAIDHALLYAKGGAAWADDKYSLFLPGFFGDTASETRVGGLVGAGVEYAFAPNWSGKIEYNFIDFGDRSVTFSGTDPAFIEGVRDKINTVTVGVNYRFGWGQ
jgi:outer membrane immunogenic protein